MSAFQPLPGIYEPSAIQQLPDGRFLVVEDEKDHPMSLLSLSSGGRVQVAPLNPAPAGDDAGLGELNDLEALALDPSGRVYAMTSHSRTSEGREKPSRHKLIRFRVEGGRIQAAELCRTLKDALINTYPVMAAAAQVLDVKNQGGLNIEALEMAQEESALLIGFRSPLLEGRAVIARLENLDAIFSDGEAPRLGRSLVQLDLGGHGIRGMAWCSALAGYLVISGPVARDVSQFRLWLWTGNPAEPAQAMAVPGLEGLERAEGISTARLDGKTFLILVSDDGDRKSGRAAQYVLIAPESLRPASAG